MGKLCAQPASLGTPTNCCISGVLECQAKSDFATLCGFSEYTSPTVPPKKYRKQTLAGAQLNCIFTGGACVTIFQSSEDVYTGTYAYNATTCAETNGQNYGNAFHSGTSCSAGQAITSNAGVAKDLTGWPNNTIDGTLVTDAISKTWSYAGSCLGSGGLRNKHSGGPLTAILNDEDLEQDAILRADVPLSWGANSTCSAYIITRGAGSFTFGYKHGQVRLNLTLAVIGHTYDIKISTGRRIQGSAGPFIPFGIIQFSWTPAASTESTDWQEIPNEAGFETNASSVLITY